METRDGFELAVYTAHPVLLLFLEVELMET
jgi:hypothetical protein